MAILERDDRNRLLGLLENVPLLQNYRGRRQLLERADLEVILPLMDLEGTPFVVAGEIVRTLESYGRVTYEHEAIGMFISALKDIIGSADDNQVFLDTLLKKYSLMTPSKQQPISQSAWKGELDPAGTLEKIIGENTLRHISFLQRGIEVSRSVALVDVVGKWVGTGFLIGPNLLMTNNHVLPYRDLLVNTKFRFNYQLTFSGSDELAVDFIALPDGIFYTSKTLDYSVIELKGEPGKQWGILELSHLTPTIDDRVNIVQHPSGLPKQISFQNNFVQYADSRVVQYVTSTLPGSSGSPVFDNNWRVVALHHAGGLLTEPVTGRIYYRNEGIATDAILADIPAEIRLKMQQET
jgi:hypothetical protein